MVILTNVSNQAALYAPTLATVLIPAFDSYYRAMEKPGEWPFVCQFLAQNFLHLHPSQQNSRYLPPPLLAHMYPYMSLYLYSPMGTSLQ